MLRFENENDFLKKTDIMQAIYNSFRVVDPIPKRVVIMGGNGELPSKNIPCYHMWKRDDMCVNCISMRTINEDKVFIKLGEIDKGFYMVTSIPIMIGEEKLVMETVQNITEGMYLDTGNPQLELQKLTKQLAICTEEMILKDALTGLYNRRFIEERLKSSLHIALEGKKDYSLIFIDIDNFKRINDTWGHLAGDDIIVQFATLIKDNLQVLNSWLARYGGEEFLIALPNISELEAFNIAQHLRTTVNNSPFVCEGQKINITCSLGVYSIKENDYDVRKVIKSLDNNLYRAKREGKNRVKSDNLG